MILSLKDLKFVGRFGFDTWNKNNIDRIKWPEQYKAQRFRDENGNLVFDRVTEEQKMKQTSLPKEIVMKSSKQNYIMIVDLRNIM